MSEIYNTAIPGYIGIRGIWRAVCGSGVSRTEEGEASGQIEIKKKFGNTTISCFKGWAIGVK